MKKIVFGVVIILSVLATSCNSDDDTSTEPTRNLKEEVSAVLNSLESGSTDALEFINPNKYIQHNLAVEDGRDALEGFISILPRPQTKADIKRVFQDGDFVFTHTEYDIFGPKIGFDIFRYENGLIVEHWDNLQETAGPNPSGRTMIDGTTSIQDLDKTEENKTIARNFVDDILVQGNIQNLASHFDGDNYLQHNPNIGDGVSGLENAISDLMAQGITFQYDEIHMVIGEGNFVLVLSEGNFAGAHTAFYDLFRIENGKIAEHWDTLETIPPESEWNNTNGKF